LRGGKQFYLFTLDPAHILATVSLARAIKS
jgi:hypothetical protein